MLKINTLNYSAKKRNSSLVKPRNSFENNSLIQGL